MMKMRAKLHEVAGFGGGRARRKAGKFVAAAVITGVMALPQGAQAQWARATGGSVTNEYVDANGIDWRIHVFANDGVLTITQRGNIEYMIVGGGGGGGGSTTAGGGGGAGGVLHNLGGAPFYVSAGISNIVVGAGGTGSTSPQGTPASTDGAPSSAFGLTAIGGGGGGGYNTDGFTTAPRSGGSGGGGGSSLNAITYDGAAGEAGPPEQGKAGGSGMSIRLVLMAKRVVVVVDSGDWVAMMSHVGICVSALESRRPRRAAHWIVPVRCLAEPAGRVRGQKKLEGRPPCRPCPWRAHVFCPWSGQRALYGRSCTIHGRAKLELGVPRRGRSGRSPTLQVRDVGRNLIHVTPVLKRYPYTVHLNQLGGE
jgi:hypothetical protein